MNAIQDLIQSAWVENESAIQKKREDEENAKARMAAKVKADAAWARAHEARRPCPKIPRFVRIGPAAAALVLWVANLPWIVEKDFGFALGGFAL